MSDPDNDGKPRIVTDADDKNFSPRDAQFVNVLRELMNTPAQAGGKTSRRVLMAFQVYHENDFPIMPADKRK